MTEQVDTDINLMQIDLNKWLLAKSIENMVEYYSSFLIDVTNRRKPVDSVSKGIRRRLMEYGVLRKFGNKFELTNLGINLIREKTARLLQ
jgi:hypothetical protein